MRSIILYFGSFNPVHEGHTAVARYVMEAAGAVCFPAGDGGLSRAGDGRICDRPCFDELWFVVSPRNPLKDDAGLAPDRDRLAMVRIAVSERLEGLPVRVGDVEFALPKPSYTIDTLRFLERENPDCTFSILAGADILEQLPRWKEHEELLAKHKFFIYPRECTPSHEDGGLRTSPDGVQNIVWLADAPRWDCSSTGVRATLEAGGDASAMVAPGVLRYIYEHALWTPATAGAWLRRGKIRYHNGALGLAYGDFKRAHEIDPANLEAAGYLDMTRTILETWHKDNYNP